ncbi:MAG TPA: GNAT family N-acetyltransferase [Candidatus Limnocylindrales bacterium]|nr:GNAT family N-acetyltransferase [Candidatus Limnocylindrales bacterium]
MVGQETAPIHTWLELPGAPSIHGLRFRRPDGSETDYEAMAALLRTTSAEDQIPWAPTATNVREEMEGSSVLDPARDAIIAEVDGSVVALASVERALRGGHPMYDVHGDVVPDQRRRGIGRALLHENLRRARERADEAGDPFPLTIRAFADVNEVGNRALLEAAGFTINRWFFLMRRPTLDDIPEAPLPEGIDLRPVREEDHRAIFDAEFEAFRDHWQPHDYDEAEFENQYKKADIDTRLWVVAWDGDEIAGVVQTWIWTDENERLGVKRGWLEHISVRRPWRRRGLGRAITAEALRRIRAAGMSDAMLGVDAENPTGALGLYEGLGFEVDQRASAYVRMVER